MSPPAGGGAPPPPLDRLVRVGYYQLHNTIGKGNFALVKLATHVVTKTQASLSLYLYLSLSLSLYLVSTLNHVAD